MIKVTRGRVAQLVMAYFTQEGLTIPWHFSQHHRQAT